VSGGDLCSAGLSSLPLQLVQVQQQVVEQLLAALVASVVCLTLQLYSVVAVLVAMGA
jgi:hypothetical protein